MTVHLHAIVISGDNALCRLLTELLPRLWPGAEVCGTAATTTAGLELADRCRPQLAFCDLSRTGRYARQLRDGLSGRCLPVFLLERSMVATAQLQRITVDYLLKPVSHEQLQRKLEDLRHRLQVRHPAADYGPPSRLQRLRVLQGNVIRMLDVDTILALTAEGNHTLVHTVEGTMHSNWSLRELTAELDDERFRPVHRHCLIRVDRVARVVRGEREQLLVQLHGCDRLFPVSRAHTALLREI